jgi:DNA-directed RNA polymerase specialized sigma24 family protein
MIESDKELVRRFRQGETQVWSEIERRAVTFITVFLTPRYNDTGREIPEKYRDMFKKFENQEKVVDEIIRGVRVYFTNHGLKKNLECYLPTVIRRAINRAYKDYLKRPDMISYDDNISNQEDEISKLKLFLKMCIEHLTDAQGKIMQLYTEGYKWADIAREFKVSRSAICQRKDAAFVSLRECIDGLY